MSVMIQVRDVPDWLHSALKARAARKGMTLADFNKRDLERVAERPTLEEWLERTQEAERILAGRTAARVLRKLRHER